MKTTDVTIKLTRDAEWELMEKYGRKCSREGLVLRAVADAIKSNGAEPKVPKTRKPRKKKDTPLLDVVPAVCVTCKWEGNEVPGSACPDCGAEVSAKEGELPEHLKDDAPYAQCSKCGRKTWAAAEFNSKCGLSQPGGKLCAGEFIPTGNAK